MTKGQVTQFVGRVPPFGRILRWWANRFVEGSVVRIQQGRAAGFLWRRHHRYVNGYWIGHYELPIQEAITHELKMGQTFFDVGANAGFFTLVAARAVGSTGRCVAFDPSPCNCESIKAQIQLNDLRNCQSVQEAIADQEGQAKFCFPAPGAATGHLGQPKEGDQELEVKLATLDSAADRFGIPALVKMDIEGAEGLAFKGAVKLLRSGRPTWLIELHGPECGREVGAVLSAAGYRFAHLDGSLLRKGDALPHHVLAYPS